MTDFEDFIVPLPQFDHGEFRWNAARYVKRLIRARWKSKPHFLSEEELLAWKLDNITIDSKEGWQLLSLAAQDLGILNREFLPREGSGGVAGVSYETAVGRLIWALAFLVPSEGGGPEHNRALIDAAEVIRTGKSVDWEKLVDWEQLPQIRDDLDELPELGTESADNPIDVIARICDLLDGQSLKLFNYFLKCDRKRVSYSCIYEDQSSHKAFRDANPNDAAIIRACKRLKEKLEKDTIVLKQVQMTVGKDSVTLEISEGQI